MFGQPVLRPLVLRLTHKPLPHTDSTTESASFRAATVVLCDIENPTLGGLLRPSQRARRPPNAQGGKNVDEGRCAGFFHKFYKLFFTSSTNY